MTESAPWCRRCGAAGVVRDTVTRRLAHEPFGHRVTTLLIRLLDMVEGRSKQVFKTWLQERSHVWRERIEVVAMDGFTGFKTAAQEVLPDAVEVMDPFHVVQLAGDALDRTRQRVQQETLGHRGRKGDPLDGVRRSLRTGEAFLTEKQHERLEAVFADPACGRVAGLAGLSTSRRGLSGETLGQWSA